MHSIIMVLMVMKTSNDLTLVSCWSIDSSMNAVFLQCHTTWEICGSSHINTISHILHRMKSLSSSSSFGETNTLFSHYVTYIAPSDNTIFFKWCNHTHQWLLELVSLSLHIIVFILPTSLSTQYEKGHWGHKWGNSLKMHFSPLNKQVQKVLHHRLICCFVFDYIWSWLLCLSLVIG